ncbi:hypothetical protein GGX14DRAFT_190115 [Mycena pura]|uniref:Uncharacterized protein n=1 Tax=Mycena pura TaxID=153505 RepID=A0AAD6VVQ4_9AGAR|nr:hypothetical protein GGX14DRAFT_190115 [Mycena pura]
MHTARDVGPGLDGQDIYQLKIIFLNLAAAAVTYGIAAPSLQVVHQFFFTIGILLCVGTMSSYTLIRKGLQGQVARQTLLAIVLIMLFAATAHLGLYIGYILLQLPTLAAEYVDPGVTLQRLNIARTCLRRLTYFLSDIIVVWRAWVIWQENRMMHAFLALCIVATGVTSLTLLVFNFNSTFHGVHYTLDAQNFLGTFGLLVTNFFATALIGYKLWYYRRNIKKYINRSNNSHTKIESILILLMESGGLYCVFWILLMIGDYGYYGPDFGFEWFQPNISGLYPTIIIFMVSRELVISDEVLSYNGSFPSSSHTERTVTVLLAESPRASALAERGAPTGRLPHDSLVVLNSFSQKQPGDSEVSV